MQEVFINANPALILQRLYETLAAQEGRDVEIVVTPIGETAKTANACGNERANA